MNSEFQELAIKEPEEAPVLIQEIVMKADRVFLWVKFVVAPLLAGLRNRDDILVLQQYLRALLVDLEHLYEHMLKVRIDSGYEQQSPQIFHLVHAVHEPFTTISLALALDQKLYITLYTRDTILTTADISGICGIMSDRPKSRCAGVIEIRGVHEESGNLGTV